MAPDRAIDLLASRQHGVISVQQAHRAGLTDNMIQYRVRSGAWLRLVRGVYALASAAPTWERQVSAALLSRAPSVVAGASAAALHRFEGFRPARPEIVVPPISSARSPIARVTRCEWFDDLRTVRVRGFPVTDEAETIVALAGRLDSERVEQLLDSRLVAGRVVVDDFEPIRRRVASARIRGASRLFPLLDERAIDAWEPPTNELERYLGRLVDHPGVPPATRQYPLRVESGRALVDLYIAAWRLILEADGRRWHTRRADFERDRARDNAAAAGGMVVLRFTWRMLTRDVDGCRRLLLDTGSSRSPSQRRPEA